MKTTLSLFFELTTGNYERKIDTNSSGSGVDWAKNQSRLKITACIA
ncbi:hypothetical protein D8N18_RS23330 [Escherichia coli]|nr:hypothetical protein [Escherichia coli]EED0306452.1 hypothetical protein [Escherichia coli]EEX5926005.1 hypothetical protein [Escherichia coli]EGK3843983.1 hypothetical protein [Escherichia coli]EHK6131645.1 hypothetical protein [Escherichia coli]EHM4467179.1 hypothetical protein [Escherichia coli]